MIASVAQSEAPEDLSAAAPRILVIDDESALHHAIKLALKDEGYQLFFAVNGLEGAELFRKHRPHLVFLDLKMPVADGYRFLEEVKVKEDALYTVIAITGHGSDNEIERCYRLGVDIFLKKPLSMVELCCIARRCIETKRLKAEREGLIASLQQAKDTIRHLKSFLVICSSCRRVRDNDQWHELLTYISSQTTTRFSHGLCPDCMKSLYPELADKIRPLIK